MEIKYLKNYKDCLRIAAAIFAAFLWRPLAAEMQDRNLWAEAHISDASPYLQQTLVYTLKLISKTALASANPDLSAIEGVSLKRIEGPLPTYFSSIRGQRYTVTEFHYALTPMMPGKIEIPPTQIKVTQAAYPAYPRTKRGGQETRTLKTNRLLITVQPPAIANQTWLPLYALEIEENMQQQGQTPRAGEPLTLSFTLKAVGAGGEQLPGLASYLQSPDFKIYPDRPETSRKIIKNADLLFISGQRLETYTLVPQREGDLKLPELRISWWDVWQEREALTEWPGRTIRVAGPVSQEAASPQQTTSPQAANPAEKEESGNLFYFILAGLVLFGLGWQFGTGQFSVVRIRMRFHVGLAVLTGWLQKALLHGGSAREWLTARVYKPFRTKAIQAYFSNGGKTASPKTAKSNTGRKKIISIITPRARLRTKLRSVGARLLPGHFNIHLLIRAVKEQDDPHTLCLLIRQFSHDRLNMPLTAPLPQIADALILAHPHLNSSAVCALFRNLDDALYANNSGFDIDAWIADFSKLFKQFSFLLPRLRRRKRAGLPALNPPLSQIGNRHV
ncbi:MAG: protein BatD [Gammaproteobacteria bacterium]|nr:protein BatD [Gammaproteobacteria bacterium]